MTVKDGDEWCGSTWISNPPDGVLCLVGSRRTLDINGHCTDYARCKATIALYEGRVVDRCLLLPAHEGEHHGGRCRRWRNDG